MATVYSAWRRLRQAILSVYSWACAHTVSQLMVPMALFTAAGLTLTHIHAVAHARAPQVQRAAVAVSAAPHERTAAADEEVPECAEHAAPQHLQ